MAKVPSKDSFYGVLRERVRSGLSGQVPPEASMVVVCSREVCKGVVVAFKTTPE